ncbi:tryptophan synthase subunit alpha [Lamprobacter modestohalophilus]|uniref:Tryptophan synthase alpha chain n=1 Tax=Lamprobacter modestohalophilus TaxID=1064514 RepID=A0A9X0WD54_9GAMM|nr:tryptophan synthase subunit alpha [Lamprobacter modestohalophilus]MBK1621231.1 tryptophan synthase subunit alpha [Lamprobacter modestohalophilus]
MSRIQTLFDRLRSEGRTALIPFITAGDPTPELTLELMHRMVAAGADLIELGVPFSDPIADGPVIQRATERALAQGVSLRDVLGIVRRFRETDDQTPVVLMGYLNPIEVMGNVAFAEAASEAGMDGALIVDVPPEESHELVDAIKAQGLDLVYLLAPTSDAARIEAIAEVASGFVYYVSVKGVTGAGHLDVDEVKSKLDAIRARIELPVGVGFGIRDAATAAQVAQVADAVIVGSAIVGRIEALAQEGQAERIPAVIGDFLSELRVAIDQTNDGGQHG